MSDNNATTPQAPPPPAPIPVPSPDNVSGDTNKPPAQRGGRSSRSRGRNGGRGHGASKRKDMGRGAWTRNNEKADKRLKLGNSIKDGEEEKEEAATATSEGEKEKEARKPKRKVAVLIGYCGTGYHGMQVNPPHRSIEGDIFEALVKAGAISRDNSNDPKKSSLVRCARTDKGVHAAGNVISLKLIIQDPDLVKKINEALPEQIRVWGIVRTVGSFSCYQQCDSRRYEYLIPSHVFLPPQPKSYLGRLCREIAEKEGDLEAWQERQKEVEGWWEAVEKKVSEMELLDREAVEKLLEEESEVDHFWARKEKDVVMEDPPLAQPQGGATATSTPDESTAESIKKIKSLYHAEKKAYRISPERLARVRAAFKSYEGTNNFHNYTVEKSYNDPSSKRHIKSFEVLDPITINTTEYLSLRVHGQSFMMHQIRKMVGLAMMVVRTGCPPSRIPQTFGPRKIAIAKAPGLGLLLEAPVFKVYNEKVAKEFEREPIDFDKYKVQRDAFREEKIYKAIFEAEEKGNVFTGFVQFLDTYKSLTYSYLTSAGFKLLDEAEKSETSNSRIILPAHERDSEDEGEDCAEGG